MYFDLQVYLPQLSGCSIAPPKRAVNEICLAVPRGEFFGFVGVNGTYMYYICCKTINVSVPLMLVILAFL